MDEVGDPAQLAGQPANAPTAARIILGGQLRRLRERAGITRAEAGYSIRSSESKISRVELGRVGVKERDVADLLTMYGVHDNEERRWFLRLAEQSSERGWWRHYHDVMPNWFSGYMGLEESATRILIFELQFVPGLLQTEEYARTLAGFGQPAWDKDAVERRVAMRMRRQKPLTRPDGPRLWAVIDESALRRPIGGHDVLKRQLDALLEWTMLPHIALQVLPFERGGLAAESAFTLLRFAEPDLPDIVYIEHLTGGMYLDKPDDIEQYGRSIDRLAVDAAAPDETRQIIAKIRSDL